MKTLTYTKKHLSEILWIIIAIGVLLLFVEFVTFNTKMANSVQQTKELAMQTSGVVQGQTQILNAIKQVTEDNNITAKQQTDIIICMLQVPVAERTTDLQAQCKKSVSSSVSSNTYESNTGSGSNSVAPSPKTTPAATQSQSQSSQPKKQNAAQRVINSIGKSIRSLL